MTLESANRIDLPEYRGNCRRNHYRVDTWLPINVGWLARDDVSAWVRELNTPREESHALGEPLLEKRLSQLEAKIDLLLKREGFDVEVPLEAQEKEQIQLSGSGLRLATNGVLRIDDYVRVEMFLPEKQGVHVRALGEVVSESVASGDAQQRSVSIAFRTIRETDREAIIRHVYEVQRVILQAQSKRDNLS